MVDIDESKPSDPQGKRDRGREEEVIGNLVRHDKSINFRSVAHFNRNSATYCSSA
jgi:hypothetical protein